MCLCAFSNRPRIQNRISKTRAVGGSIAGLHITFLPDLIWKNGLEVGLGPIFLLNLVFCVVELYIFYKRWVARPPQTHSRNVDLAKPRRVAISGSPPGSGREKTRVQARAGGASAPARSQNPPLGPSQPNLRARGPKLNEASSFGSQAQKYHLGHLRKLTAT